MFKLSLSYTILFNSLPFSPPPPHLHGLLRLSVTSLAFPLLEFILFVRRITFQNREAPEKSCGPIPSQWWYEDEAKSLSQVRGQQ